MVSGEPGELGSRRGGRRDARQLTAALGQRQRVLDRGRRTAIAAAPAGEPEDHSDKDLRHRRAARVTQELRRVLGCLGPQPTVEHRARPDRVQVEDHQVEPPLATELEPRLDVPVGRLGRAVTHRDGCEVHERPREVRIAPGLSGELDAALELLPALGRSDQELDRSDADEGVDEDLDVTVALGELDGAHPPDARLHRVIAVPVELGQRAVGLGQLPARRIRRVNRQRPVGHLFGLGDPAGTPQPLREHPQRLAFPACVAELAVDPAGALERLDGVVVSIDQVALIREALEHSRELRCREAIAVPECLFVMGRRLAMGTGRGRTLGGRGRVPEHQLGYVGGLGMVGEPGGIARAGACVGQRRER